MHTAAVVAPSNQNPGAQEAQAFPVVPEAAHVVKVKQFVTAYPAVQAVHATFATELQDNLVTSQLVTADVQAAHV